MKKFCLTLLMLVVAHAMVGAHDFEVDGVYYKFTPDSTSVKITFKGNTQNDIPYYNLTYKGDFTIPSEVTYNGTSYPVTAIGAYAFYRCHSLNHVTIPSSILAIEGSAFYDCYHLTDVVIPNSVTSIARNAFYECHGITSIHIPSSVTSIGATPFGFCINLTTMTVAEDNPKYDSRDNCNAIIETATNVLVCGSMNTTIPNTVTAIGDESFYNLSLTSITIPNSVTSIGNHAFHCNDLISVDLPNSVTTIKPFAFCNCTEMTSITLPNSIKEIGYCAFSGCRSLTAIDLPDSITSIGQSLFDGCSKLVSVDIPNTVTSIGMSAFGDCTSLESIFIPKSVTSISSFAFIKCNALSTIVVEDGNPVYDSRDNCNGIIKTAANQLVVGFKNTVIPNTVTSINGAFYNVESLTHIDIPNSVTEIDYQSFYKCTGLTGIDIPETVTLIGYEAFRNCTGLTSIDIPSSVTKIGMRAFYDCTGLTRVISRSTTPPELHHAQYTGDQCFNCYDTTPLFVPFESIDAYRGDAEWGKFATIVPFVGAGPGDVDGDNMIGISDASSLIDMLLNGELPAYADVNGDGEVSISDVSDLIDMLLNN